MADQVQVLKVPSLLAPFEKYYAKKSILQKIKVGASKLIENSYSDDTITSSEHHKICSIVLSIYELKMLSQIM